MFCTGFDIYVFVSVVQALATNRSEIFSWDGFSLKSANRVDKNFIIFSFILVATGDRVGNYRGSWVRKTRPWSRNQSLKISRNIKRINQQSKKCTLKVKTTKKATERKSDVSCVTDYDSELFLLAQHAVIYVFQVFPFCDISSNSMNIITIQIQRVDVIDLSPPLKNIGLWLCNEPASLQSRSCDLAPAILKEQMALWVSGVRQSKRMERSDLWEMAAKFKEKIHRGNENIVENEEFSERIKSRIAQN